MILQLLRARAAIDSFEDDSYVFSFPKTSPSMFQHPLNRSIGMKKRRNQIYLSAVCDALPPIVSPVAMGLGGPPAAMSGMEKAPG
jgi:hypothetical protein